MLVEGNDCVEVGNSWDWRVEHENGTGSAKSEINLVADRYHRDNILSCQVNSRALKVRLCRTNNSIFLREIVKLLPGRTD